MFQSPDESKRQQHEGKGTQIQEGKAARNTVNGAGPQVLYMARPPLILMGTSGQSALSKGLKESERKVGGVGK